MREGPGITENERYAERSELDAAFEPCRSYNELQIEGSQYCLFLEKLSASYIIEANDFFRKTQSDWVWENLTSLTLTSELLAEDACHLRATNMLANAAGAALQMPRLQRMEIWYGEFRTAALFRYAVSESGTSIRWHGTWELQLQRRLVDAWSAVAELHTANELVVHSLQQGHQSNLDSD
ncbi:hypothetical protein K4K59_006368 [Colletotrichum sp. SAR11_240]|nr:hypothetical protein K4K59_006368 [Colletotrichum sp. SAR11_240]